MLWDIPSINLFSGIGGLRVGRPRAYVEINPDSRKILKKRIRQGLLPPAKVYKDVRTFHPKKAQLVCAGFPCQNLSSAGLRKGLKGKSKLFFEVLRIAEEAEATWIFMENVSNLLFMPQAIRGVLRHLSRAGYETRWVCNRASQYGLPHRRERVFFLCRKIGPFKVRIPHGGQSKSGYCHPGGVVPEKPIQRPEVRAPMLLKKGRKEILKERYPTPRAGGGSYALYDLNKRSAQDIGTCLKLSSPRRRRQRKRWANAGWVEALMGFPPGWTHRLRRRYPREKLCKGSQRNTRRLWMLGMACCPRQCHGAFKVLFRRY